jgi:hypothetical protein
MKVKTLSRSVGIRFGDLKIGKTFIMVDDVHLLNQNVRLKVHLELVTKDLRNCGVPIDDSILKGCLAVNLSNGALVIVNPQERIIPKEFEAVEKSDVTKV